MGRCFSLVSPMPQIGYAPKLGDIVLIQPPFAAHTQAGHVQARGGKYWISDFSNRVGPPPRGLILRTRGRSHHMRFIGAISICSLFLAGPGSANAAWVTHVRPDFRDAL